MIQKIENCTYCGGKMKDVKSAKRKFCNDKCRIYYGRELKRGTLDIPIRPSQIEAKFEARKDGLLLNPNTIGVTEKIIIPQPKKRKTVEDYIREKREMTDEEKYNQFLLEVENDSSLSLSQKIQIRRA